jgi:hypothetical protein
VALAHDATHVNAVADVQSPSTSAVTSRAPPLESAGRSTAMSAASELTDEELELQLTRKATAKVTRPVLTIFRR